MNQKGATIIFLLFVLTKQDNLTDSDLPKRMLCFTPRSIECADQTNNSDDEPIFLLYTRRNPNQPELLNSCGKKLPINTNFDKSHRTVAITHGYGGAVCLEQWEREMKDQLLIRGNYNVILVDWSYMAFKDYAEVIRNLKMPANKATELINNIKEQTGVTGRNFHLIGHSVGAHLSAYVGQDTAVRRITGLDPAGPGFYNVSLDDRLDPSDARYVDVIHTGSSECLPFIGCIYPMGHEDFYPNGGSIQLSCFPENILGLSKGDIARASQLLAVASVCSHGQSVQYFKMSINPNGCEYVGKECQNLQQARSGQCDSACKKDSSNCSIMGMNWERNYIRKIRNSRQRTRRQTIYYLETSLVCPYCITRNSSLSA